MKKQFKKIFIGILSILILFLAINIVRAENLATKLKGKILLQVEQNGEAWYINPADEKRYYMGRPDDAFDLMRKLGTGISEADIRKIPVGDKNLLSGPDSDGDGLSDMIEDSFGTDKYNPDSDNDGYDDKTEILAGFDPLGPGRLPIDHNFADRQKGKILLQVERNGEAWYVYPGDKKRYFLGRPADAFNLMRELGLGISNNNLNSIPNHQDSDCVAFPDYLDSCSPFKCQFEHPIMGDKLYKEILGFFGDRCKYKEEMPNNGLMECNYTEASRKSIVQYYKGFSGNPFQSALDSGECTISGYNDNKQCPEGTVYKGESYTYENGEQIAHVICSDPNMICPQCENCVSGSFKKVISGSGEVCYECLFSSHCKTGYTCEDRSCIQS